MTQLLNQQEQTCLNTLADAWDKFLELPSLHPWHSMEFMHAIHVAQNIVLSRPALLAQALEREQQPPTKPPEAHT